MRARIAVGLVLASCAAPDGAWVAHGDRASVGMVRDGGEAIAYVCGRGDEDRPVWTRWFATASWGGDSLVTERDGWQLRAEIIDDLVEIELDGPAGEAASWTAAADPLGGLYEHVGNCRDGAIIANGEAVGAWCDPDATFWQVEPVGTLVPTDDTLRLRAVFEGAPEFDARRVIP